MNQPPPRVRTDGPLLEDDSTGIQFQNRGQNVNSIDFVEVNLVENTAAMFWFKHRPTRRRTKLLLCKETGIYTSEQTRADPENPGNGN